MRSFAKALCVVCCTCFCLAGCGEVPIGQPCTFSWPRDAEGTTDCSDYPACAPLQDTSGAVSVNDNACPIDCIQMPSLQCENLICVATQIEGEHKHMNGQCTEDLTAGTECSGDAELGCMGYCTKECLSDASCPKGYSCSPMAPFGSTLNCELEKDWGESCTATCTKAGDTPDAHPDLDPPCPSSVEGDANYDYGLCDDSRYSSCCACICYRFCPLLTKKFCRKNSWDEDMFPDAITERDDCGGGSD